MNTDNIFAYLHYCGFSQSELMDISQREKNLEKFFSNFSSTDIARYVSRKERRFRILKKKSELKTGYIDSILQKLEVNLVFYHDENYPESLKHIPHSPFLLYVRGKIPAWENFSVVGSRKISAYGEKSIRTLLPDISKVFNIVSGWATGCDTFAHKVCLESWGKTVVVVGTWINICYPAINKKLFEKIRESSGAIISIFPIDEPGNPYNFPIRNEIVVGLSAGVLVIEAKEKSGSLITARLALDLWKDLFALPGDISSDSSRGTNMLIKKGEAKCILESQCVLEEYDVYVKRSSSEKQIPLLQGLEQKLYECISSAESDIDSLVEKFEIPISKLAVTLSLLELKWLIKKWISWKYITC